MITGRRGRALSVLLTVVVVAAGSWVWHQLPDLMEVEGPFDITGVAGEQLSGRDLDLTVSGARVAASVRVTARPAIPAVGRWVVVDARIEARTSFAQPEAELLVGPNTYTPSDRFMLTGLGSSSGQVATLYVGEGRGPLPSRPHPAPWRTLVVIPTYNEKGNVEPIVEAVHGDLDCDVLIVDDGSPDGTGEIADRMAERDERVRVMHREGKQGLGTAYIAGFRYAMEHGYERVCEMDADFSHAPWDLPRLVFASADAELVIGSRYVKGGCTVGWGFRRRMLSRGANLYARMVLSSGIRDNTAGFRCFHVDALRQLDLDAVHLRQRFAQLGQPTILVVVARVRNLHLRPEPVRLRQIVHPRPDVRVQELQQLELGELHDGAARRGLRAQ